MKMFIAIRCGHALPALLDTKNTIPSINLIAIAIIKHIRGSLLNIFLIFFKHLL